MGEVERWLYKFFMAFYQKAKEETFKEVLRFFTSFVDYPTFARWLIYRLSENLTLKEKHKELIFNALKKLWVKESRGISVKTGVIPDERAITAFTEMTDFYLGKFFQGDQRVRERALKWMLKYYLEEGNPIGRDSKGIDEFLKKFGRYLDKETQTKARQIIDTTANMVRNAAKVKKEFEVGTKFLRWDATNDRLTCKACRSLDGRIIKVEEAYNQLLDILRNPQNLPSVRPIITKPFEGKTSDLPVKFPPLHPHCRCRVKAHRERRTLPFIVRKPPIKVDSKLQSSLEKFVENLTPQELQNRYNALLGAKWYRTLKQWENRKNYERHFKKHAGKLGIKSLQEYMELPFKILRKPDRIYLQRYIFKDKKRKKYEEITDWVIESQGVRVIIEDDTLLIKSVHPIEENEDEFYKRAEEKERATVKIL